MAEISLLLMSIAVLIAAITYSYTMIKDMRELKKELENIRKKYNL